MTLRLLPALLLLCALPVHGEPSAQDALGASTGTWEGELYYLDYQSGQRFGIPVRIDADVTPDGATLIRRLTYTDPGVLVYAVNLVTVEESGQLVEAFFRDNNAEMLRYDIDSVSYKDDSDWTVVYSQDGVDDNRPARIRHTLSRTGDLMTSSKEVRFLDTDDDEFFLRNGIEVRLLPPADN